MGKLVVMLVLVATSALAADIIPLKNGMIFSHKEHQDEKVGKCFVCHDNVSVSHDESTVSSAVPGKIAGFGKEWAHKNCTDCHDLYSAGPVTCAGCHTTRVSGVQF